MSSPLKPHWDQPSHSDVQEVIISTDGFLSKSLSRVELPPFAVFAKMLWPPCTEASEPTYATVQFSKDRHLNLNSDLLYINHSCDPSLIFNTSTFEILVGPKGLKPGDELTFFYPSTEWHMAQAFDCFCQATNCRGRIAGAKDMTAEQLSGLYLNGHIHALLEERDAALAGKKLPANHPPAVSCHDTGSETEAKINGIAPKTRNGPTSRELGGEMGGDTVA
ncbi:galactose-proton symport [Ceratocystis lukuohia]|uniref:Galactose-proton symport n=1 Tax=Ceratocystis lukuohia TaxID=2019550 RepID=A0ABR4MD93_9PEZI